MATVDEEIARLKFISAQGRGGEKCHVVLIEVEAKKKIKNPKQKTRFSLETDDPKMYSKMHELKDRWFGTANKSVALTVMASLWDRPVEWIKEICDQQERYRENDSPAFRG